MGAGEGVENFRRFRGGGREGVKESTTFESGLFSDTSSSGSLKEVVENVGNEGVGHSFPLLPWSGSDGFEKSFEGANDLRMNPWNEQMEESKEEERY
jgi:hypothetical protein